MGDDRCSEGRIGWQEPWDARPLCGSNLPADRACGRSHSQRGSGPERELVVSSRTWPGAGVGRRKDIMAISFGIFDWIDRRSTPLGRVYEERLQLLEAADQASFGCYHLAEHHATPLGMAPSPSVFLAAAAQRTRRIRFGPLVYLLPLYSPLRLIGEICMLDHLSGGRLEVGVGRGISPYEVGYHGLAVERTRPMFLEAFSVLIAGMTNDRLTYKGEYYRYENVRMELAPLQRPYPPIWYATNTVDNVEWAAARGMNLVGLGPAPVFRTMVDRHRGAWLQHQDD